MKPSPRHPLDASPAPTAPTDIAAGGRAGLDALLEEFRARADAIADERADALDRWQIRQEARLEQSLAEMRDLIERRLAEIPAPDRAGDPVAGAEPRAADSALARIGAEADRASATLTVAAERAIAAITSAGARLQGLAHAATAAAADAGATLDHRASEVRAGAERVVKEIDAAIDAAVRRAREAAAAIEEGFAHHAASLAARAGDAFAAAARAEAGPADATRNARHLADELRGLLARAEQSAGLPAPELAMPAHEAPPPWPPAPPPGSLADLVAKGQSVVARARHLINDLARQIHAADQVRESLEGTVQDASAALRGQRERLEQIRSLVLAGFEAGFELDQNLTSVVVEANIVAERLERAQEAASTLREATAEASRLTAAVDERLALLRKQTPRALVSEQPVCGTVETPPGKAAA